MSSSELYDQGAQPERTLLAWGRTCLALAVVVAVVVKVFADDVDPTVITLTVAGLVLPVLTWLLAVARYRRIHRELTRPGGSRLPAGGAAMAAATGAALLCGGLALLLVLT